MPKYTVPAYFTFAAESPEEALEMCGDLLFNTFSDWDLPDGDLLNIERADDASVVEESEGG